MLRKKHKPLLVRADMYTMHSPVYAVLTDQQVMVSGISLQTFLCTSAKQQKTTLIYHQHNNKINHTYDAQFRVNITGWWRCTYLAGNVIHLLNETSNHQSCVSIYTSCYRNCEWMSLSIPITALTVKCSECDWLLMVLSLTRHTEKRERDK